MMSRKKPGRPDNFLTLLSTLKARHQCGWSFWLLILVLFALSLVAGANFGTAKRIYVAGQIADSDVVADRDLRVENYQATKRNREQAVAMQPPVYDLTMEPFMQFQTRLVDILRELNTGADEGNDTALQLLREEIGQQEAESIFPELVKPEVQTLVLKKLLPLIREQMAEGIVSDARSARTGSSGIFLRNLDTGTETLRPEVRSLPDVQSFLAEISAIVRREPGLNQRARNAVNTLLATTMPTSLTLNREATQQKGAEIAASIAPTYYQILKGELLLRKGDVVSPEQQLKIQSLYKSSADPLRWNIVAGAFISSLFFSIGFFMSPSGKMGSPLRRKDIYMISVILLLCGIGAKCVYLFGLRMDSPALMGSFTAAFPVAGFTGLVAMVFAARRYCVMGLLLSFFSMLMFEGSYPLFIYYFLSGMLATWLVIRALNRQDVVWSVLPLSLGMLFLWSGMACLSQTPLMELPMQATSVIINALLSLIILFAFSPVLEMAFGYSTRFRLMELMSLDQPLMQEIMVTIQGTYHHSLVVANMVEAGAKAIGANSLLCKVAALYHDAGKLGYPEYFIENQFGAPNRHDKLAPSMSALILQSHVKRGTELAEKYKLGEEIIDIIRQHHGTRLMRFFFQKALDMGENPREDAYSYPGPRPQSREAAILMLADSVEASSRTLTDPTPARIKNHIDTIIKGIFAEGQLDESELTFKDLHHLSENFQRILTGIFHQRIAYPESKIKAREGDKGNTKNNNEPADKQKDKNRENDKTSPQKVDKPGSAD